MDNICNDRPLKWSVGVVTAPRPNACYLDRSLQSLENAGWKEVVIFAEPGSITPSNSVTRRKKFGDWSNWACGLYELLLTEPDADYFMMVEDDCVVCQGSKTYLEENINKLLPFGSLSLYCPERYCRKYIGFHNECQGWMTCSTLTVIMPRESVISFFADTLVQHHRFEHILPIAKEEVPWGVNVDPQNSIKDAVLGMWAERNSFPIFYHSPSLAQHIGEVSNLTNQAMPTAPDFVGETFMPAWKDVIIRRFVQTPVF